MVHHQSSIAPILCSHVQSDQLHSRAGPLGIALYPDNGSIESTPRKGLSLHPSCRRCLLLCMCTGAGRSASWKGMRARLIHQRSSHAVDQMPFIRTVRIRGARGRTCLHQAFCASQSRFDQMPSGGRTHVHSHGPLILFDCNL